MKLNSDQLKKIVSAAKSAGFEVGLRDISYILLLRSFEESVYAFRAVFGDLAPVPFTEYSVSKKIDYLKEYMEEHHPVEKEIQIVEAGSADDPEVKEREARKEKEGMSFDEIKKGLEDDLKALMALRDDVDEDGVPRLDAKEMATVVGRIADIRVKLTEKFKVESKEIEQRIVVNQKFNAICPYCNHEVAIKVE